MNACIEVYVLVALFTGCWLLPTVARQRTKEDFWKYLGWWVVLTVFWFPALIYTTCRGCRGGSNSARPGWRL